ncbi:MAG: NAD(P)-dependent oxidoreductase [Bacteroidales bacterium]|nr:NAD(P)-dependent oxidoreductase [Bacteroidales bacterium]
MSKKIKVGILKETKTPPDKRTAISPKQGIELSEKFSNVELFIQSSDIRAYKDEEYTALGLQVTEDVSHCDILIGVKEVHIPELIANKTYLFFSHTAKEQEYNRSLLQEFLKKKIKMLDHEYFTDEKGMRLVAFGNWAGLVGAYNGLIALGKRTGSFDLKRAIDCHDIKEVMSELKKIKVPAVKFLITGGGRVAHGAMEVLEAAGIKQISPDDFMNKNYDYAVYTKLDPDSYVKRKDDSEFDLHHFFDNPEMYESTFKPYTKVADVYVACHFWDENSPVFMSKDDMKEDDFKISVIADVSCDIAGPIPSTIRPSEIADPFYGYNAETEKEADAFDKNNITVMAVDNLPGEVPRDASVDFGKGLIEKIFPALFGEDTTGIIERASITENGKLGKHFQYLKDFAESK